MAASHSIVFSHASKKARRSRALPRGIAALLSIVLLAAAVLASPVPAAAGGMGWYTVRAKDHSQPVADPPLRVVEEYGGYYIDHTHTRVDDPDKVVYLTFDAGYENGNVAKVLDTLKEAEVTGAFFILGHLAEACPALVRRMAEEGHLVCNHTDSHKNLCGATKAEIEGELGRLAEICLSAAGVTVAKYFRPPEGCFDIPLLQTAQALGYKTVFWSFAYADWDNSRQPDPAAAKKKILDHAHNGAVILLHPTSATNAAILGDVIAELKSQGYRFGALDELTGGV